MKTHLGAENRASADFFVPPPADIGAILSAETTLDQHRQPMTAPSRLSGSAFAGLVVGLSAAGALFAFKVVSPQVIFLTTPILTVVAAGLAWWMTRFHHHCTYVGAAGIARFECRGGRNNLTMRDVLVFQNARELRSLATEEGFWFKWLDAGEKQLFWVAGRGEKTSRWNFARAAEDAWTRTLLEDARKTIREGGFIQFVLSENHWLKISRGGIDILFVEQRQSKLSPAEFMEKVEMNDMAAKGTFLFMPNRKLFMELLPLVNAPS